MFGPNEILRMKKMTFALILPLIAIRKIEKAELCDDGLEKMGSSASFHH